MLTVGVNCPMVDEQTGKIGLNAPEFLRDSKMMLSLLKLKRQKYALMGSALTLDVLMLVGASMLSLYLHFGSQIPIEHAGLLLYSFPITIAFKIMLFFFWSMYADEAFRFKGATFLRIVELATIGALIELAVTSLIILYYFPDQYEFSRRALVIKAGLEIVGLTLARSALISYSNKHTLLQHRTLIIGSSDEVKSLVGDHPKSIDRQIVGFVDSAEEREDRSNDLGIPCLGTREDVRSAIADYGITELIYTGSPAIRDETLMLIGERHISVKICPNTIETVSCRMDTVDANGIPLIEVNRALLSFPNIFLRRMFDIVCSGVGLVLFAPLLIVLWTFYRIMYGGHLFFVQKRIGQNGRLFDVYKIRTMVLDSEKHTEPVLCKSDDPRVLPLGWLLRKTHLDELPQLWNVLMGDMSIVGPRPERPERAQEFIEKVPLYSMRHIVKPGLTGLAQICGAYNTYFEYKLRYDLIYAFNLSLILDLKILFYTPKYILSEVFGEKNQY